MKAGVSATDAVNGGFGVRSEARPYLIGPMIELGLAHSFAVEIEALYRRIGYSTTDSFFSLNYVSQVRANSWEFPILAKHYFPLGVFVSGGYVPRNFSGAVDISHTFGRDPGTGTPVDTTLRLSNTFLRDNPSHGFAAGAGIRQRLGPVRIGPEVRYTRWLGRPFDEQGSRGFFVQSQQNQLDALVGISF